MLRRTAYVLLAALALAACDTTEMLGPGPDPGPSPSPPPPPVNFTQAVPLIDLVRDDGVANTYYGFEGGLYRSGNTMPSTHAEDGQAVRRSIQPLDAGV